MSRRDGIPTLLLQFYEELRELVVQHVLMSVPARGDGAMILDVGCGELETLQRLRVLLPKARLFGVERNPRYCEAAASAEGQLIHLDYYDASKQIQAADGSLDVVTAVFVLQALSREGIESLLAHVYRVLKPGGKFIAQVFHPDAEGALCEGILGVRPSAELPNLYVIFGNPDHPGAQNHRMYFRSQGFYSGQIKSAGLVVEAVDSYMLPARPELHAVICQNGHFHNLLPGMYYALTIVGTKT